MKIRISTKQLTEELFKLQGVATSRSKLAILSHCLLVASGNTLTLHATDLDMSVSTSCACEVIEPGSVTLQTRSLFDAVKNIKEAELEIHKEDNNWAKLTSGSVSCRIAGMHADDFPQILNTSKTEMFSIEPSAMLDMIDKTLFSVAVDESRANLTGAFFKSTEDGALTMVSTDDHRLSKIDVLQKDFDAAGRMPAALLGGVIIPRKGLSEIRRTVDSNVRILLFGIVESSIVFKYGEMTLSMRLIEGTFPDFNHVIPRGSDSCAVVQKSAIVNALKLVSLFSSTSTHNVRLTLNDGSLELYASNPERGEISERVPAEYDGPEVKAGYNHKFMMDALNAVDGAEVSIEIIDTLSPTLVRDVARDDMVFVVMPMRL